MIILWLLFGFIIGFTMGFVVALLMVISKVKITEKENK